jgi:hypothetical protein
MEGLEMKPIRISVAIVSVMLLTIGNSSAMRAKDISYELAEITGFQLSLE